MTMEYEKPYQPSPFDSILEAVFTVSPNKQYRGIFNPTTPAHTGPGKGMINWNKTSVSSW